MVQSSQGRRKGFFTVVSCFIASTSFNRFGKRSARRTAMNLPQVAMPSPPGQQRHHEAATQLSGRWLLMARGAWVSLVLLTLLSFVVLLPSYFAQLQSVCISP